MTWKIVRGGSWFNGPRFCRSACRLNDLPDIRLDYVGFRVCCLPQDPLPSPTMPKLLRGGSWYGDSWYCRSACRYLNLPDIRINRVGFRVCCLLSPALSPATPWRVMRGASWNTNPRYCRSASRIRDLTNYVHCILGFRVAGLPETPFLATMNPPNLNLNMLRIPAGEFMMGSSGPDAVSSETPAHRVTLPEFMMSETLITQAQWREVASWTEQPGEKWGRQLNPDPSYFKGDDHPVDSVSWHDAMEFCNRLSQRTGRAYSLPTEAQWEYACRAGSNTKYPWGDEINPAQANYSEYKIQSTTPVGMFPANAWGLKDTIGNVWEWCLDNWHGSYEGAPTDGSAWVGDSDD